MQGLVYKGSKILSWNNIITAARHAEALIVENPFRQQVEMKQSGIENLNR